MQLLSYLHRTKEVFDEVEKNRDMVRKFWDRMMEGTVKRKATKRQ